MMTQNDEFDQGMKKMKNSQLGCQNFMNRAGLGIIRKNLNKVPWKYLKHENGGWAGGILLIARFY